MVLIICPVSGRPWFSSDNRPSWICRKMALLHRSGTVVNRTVEYRNRLSDRLWGYAAKVYWHKVLGLSCSAEKGQLRPFPAFRRGQVRAAPGNGSRGWPLAGSQGSALCPRRVLPNELSSYFDFDRNIFAISRFIWAFLFDSVFHRLFDTTLFLLIFAYSTEFYYIFQVFLKKHKQLEK